MKQNQKLKNARKLAEVCVCRLIKKEIGFLNQNINRLTVIANESYDDFAEALQKEIEEDCGVNFTGRIKDKNKREKLLYRKGFEADPKFLQIWEKIKFRTKYSVAYQTNDLITLAAKAIKDEMPETKKPSVRSTKQKVQITDEGISGQLVSDSIVNYGKNFNIPDALAYIQSKTELTRTTILDIIKKSGRISELIINPNVHGQHNQHNQKSFI